MSRYASWFAEKGFTSLELDLGRLANVSTSEALMKHYESGESSSRTDAFNRPRVHASP